MISQTLKLLIISIIVIPLLSGCFKKAPEGNNTFISHHLFDSLLHLYVDNEGMVNYNGFEESSIPFLLYLEQLQNNPPSSSWKEEDKLAYWINLYNAFTIKLIVDKKPAHSIKDITTLDIPFVNSPWQITLISIHDKLYNLDDIEHGIIREDFNEPLIHFALVCAARSCPKLRQEAYQGNKLQEQLTDQALTFLRDTLKNDIKPNRIQISKIFDWYQKDFTKEGSLIEYLNPYSPVPINSDATLGYMDYDWRLNGYYTLN